MHIVRDSCCRLYIRGVGKNENVRGVLFEIFLQEIYDYLLVSLVDRKIPKLLSTLPPS